MNRDARLRQQYISSALGDLGLVKAGISPTLMRLAPSAPAPAAPAPPPATLPSRTATARTPVAMDMPTSQPAGPAPVGTKKPETVASGGALTSDESFVTGNLTPFPEALPKVPATIAAAVAPITSSTPPWGFLAGIAGAGILLYVITRKR